MTARHLRETGHDVVTASERGWSRAADFQLLAWASDESRLFVPLGLTILVPITVNIICWEIFLVGAPGIGCLLGVLEVFLIFGYFRFFGPLLTPFASPHNPIGLKD